MNTDDIIQLFRLLDLTKLRKELDKLADEHREVLVKYLKKCQRNVPR